MASTLAGALPRRSARIPAEIAGVVVAVTGATVVYGWLDERAALVRLGEGLVPMQFNTALCLTLYAVALLLLLTRWVRLAAVPLLAGTVWGALTLLQYASGQSFGIDTLLFDPWLTVGTDSPGRMPRNTAACFTVLGAAGSWLALTGRRPGRAPLAVGTAGSLVAALALVALFGYAGGISTAYTWRTSTAMAPTTAAALLVLGIGYVAAAWGTAVSVGAPRWLPLPVGVGALAATLLLWEAMLNLGGTAERTIPLGRAAGIVLGIGVVFSALLAGGTALAQDALNRRREAERLAARLAEEAARVTEFQGVLLARTARDNVLRAAYAAVSTAPDLKAGFDGFAAAARDALTFDRCSLSLVDDGVASVVAVAGSMTETLPLGTALPVTDPLLTEIMRSREPYLVNDTAEAFPGDDSAVMYGVRAFVGAPVIVAGEPRALLRFSSAKPGVFRPDDLVLLRELVNVVGGALYTLARLQDERRTTARLRELDQLKNEFVGVVAHDLRSPMTVIVGYIETVLTHWDDLDDAMKQDLLGVASRNTKRLSTLVEDVLQVARMESGDFPFDFAPFDLGALVHRTVAEMNAARPDRPVEARVPDGLPKAYGDEDRQWRILTNLVSNAQKFSPPDVPAVVEVTAGETHLEVAVTDRGPGIPEEDLPRLFGKFARLATPPSGEKGTGLGLYICKALVEAQGGTIGAESRVGRGTTMRYTVPRARS